MQLWKTSTDIEKTSGQENRPDILSGILLLLAFAIPALHATVIVFYPAPVFVSNVFQLLSPLLATVLCLVKAAKTRIGLRRRLWTELSFAFLLWSLGQVAYLWAMIAHAPVKNFPLSDILWIFSAFPLLLVASSASHNARRDTIDWLDFAQACVFFLIDLLLVYPRAEIISLSAAYNFQNLALFLAIAMRYSISRSGSERAFYRNLGIFTTTWTVTSAINDIWTPRMAPGAIVDLCWTVPFSLFCVLALRAEHKSFGFGRWGDRKLSLPRHVHEVSALCLTGMSLAGAAVLAWHRPLPGLILSGASFVVFSARTTKRGWQLHKAHKQLLHTSLHDPLTGLVNRSFLDQELTVRLKRKNELSRLSNKTTAPLCLLLIDLDRFKTINEVFGYVFGDRLIVAISRQLIDFAGPQDILARHGSDQFFLLLENLPEVEAIQLCRKINSTLRQAFSLDGRLIHLTASIGMVAARPGTSVDSMLQEADCAMYRAKKLGKDQAQAFEPAMLESVRRRMTIENDLRVALAEGQIEVHYQPLCRPTSDKDYVLTKENQLGFEALVRWCHPVWGMISPGEFIPVAEDTGMIIELGTQVLRQACYQCQDWNQRLGLRLTVSVNVSALQLAQSDFLSEVCSALKMSGLDPHLLKLEVTESVLLNGYDAATTVLSKARALGLGVCLDDFGTGYSSLSYLLTFPFDVVKIDRSFIQHLDLDPQKSEMVRMVMGLATTLKKLVIAEGIERPAELKILRELGCDIMQGYLFSKPVSVRDMEAILSKFTGAEQVHPESKHAQDTPLATLFGRMQPTQLQSDVG